MNKSELLACAKNAASVGFRLSLMLALINSCRAPQDAIGIGKISHNQVDAQKERHGRWRVFYDDSSTQLATDGRYRHGRPVGRWHYYSPKNVLARQERYRWWQPGVLSVKEYHANGKIAKQGQARIVREGETIHYYWFGPWQEYAETGGLVSRAWYKMGQLQHREPLSTKWGK